MLIPSKFNGYVKNVRLYNAGGGIGEAMLISAAIGGGSAAITGGDPLKGALLGGLSGGVGAGISGALSGATAAGTTAAGTTAGAGAGLTDAGIMALTPADFITQNPSLYPTGSLASNASTTFMPNIASAPASVSTASPVAASASTPTSIPPVGASPTSYYTGPSQGFEARNVSSLSAPPAAAPQISALSSGPTALDVNYLAEPSTAYTSVSPGSNVISPEIVPKSSFQKAMDDPFGYINKNRMQSALAGLSGAVGAQRQNEVPDEEEYKGPLSRYRFNPDTYRPSFYAEGGITSLPLEGYDQVVGEQPMYQAMASGGISSLGSYSDGGRMLKGPGDGMSDSIPASIANKRPARLADGEFVVPSDVVSHLGNGSTDAGAKQLYAMMNKVRQARTGRKAQGREINPRQYVPA